MRLGATLFYAVPSECMEKEKKALSLQLENKRMK